MVLRPARAVGPDDLIPLAAGTEWPAAFPYLGLSTSPDDYDAWAESYPYEWGENVIFTNQEHVVNDSYHGSMGHDDGMPDAVVGGVAILGPEYVDDLHLFDADYFVSNIDRRLRGVIIEIKEETGDQAVSAGRTDATGTDVGCVTLPVSVVAGETYKIRIQADQVVHGAAVAVKDSEADDIWVEQLVSGHQFSVASPSETFTADPSEPWNILAVTGFALNRTTGGLHGGIDTTFYAPAAPDDQLHVPASCGGPCIDGDAVYLNTARARKAYVIAYSLGFTFFEAMGGVDFDDSLDDAGRATSRCPGSRLLRAVVGDRRRIGSGLGR